MEKKNYLSSIARLVLFLCLFPVLGLKAQKSIVTGIVKDDQQKVLAGINVTLKGSSISTSTDESGRFSISALNNDILIFKSIGYNTLEVPINNKTSLNVTLLFEDRTLNDVVILAYGSQQKQNITGAVQTIKTETIQDQPAGQITQKLQGQLAGVQISQTSGNLGGGMVVRIRGAASISAGNNPLYVVDGLPIFGDLSNINPDEIESISVLKDASSTSLYGSRAANGVVIVTTKHGKAGTSAITLNSYVGFQQVPQRGRPQMMNAQEFAQFKQEVALENGQAIDPMFQNPSSYGEGTNWFNSIIRNALVQNHSISINSNKEKFSSAVVLGYFDQNGIMQNTDFKRYSVRANVDYTPIKYFRAGVNIAPTYQYTRQPTTDGDIFGSTSIIQGSILSSPLAPLRNSDGSIPINTSGYGVLDAPNFYNELYIINSNSKEARILGNAFAEVTPIEGLSVKSSINIDYMSFLYNNFTPSTAGGFFNPGNANDPSRIRASVSNELNYSWLWENTANYKRSFGRHNFDLLGGYTAQYFKSENSNIGASNFPDNLVQTINAASTFNAGGNIQENTLVSYLGRLNYSYADRYIFSAAIRSDGSSRFGINKRFGTFPSFSAGWIISNENFFKEVTIISNLKLRGSYGAVGNNNIGNYTQYASVVATNYPFNNVNTNGRSVAGLNNSDLGWEKSIASDLGIDLGLWTNRITLGYDYYNKTTENLLYSVNIPISSGFFNYVTNIGKLKFWGHEFTVSTQNLVGKLKWSTNFNLSFNRNKVLQLGTSDAAVYGDLTITKVGEPIGQLYGFVFDGIYNNASEFNSSPKYVGAQVGMAKFRDVNGDGVVTFDQRDQDVIGNPSPDFVYGITNRLSYMNFDFSIVIAGQYGNKLANRVERYTNNLDGAFNVTKDVANRWRSESDPGDGRYGKAISGTTFYERDYYNSRMVYDASYLTVKNITIGYALPIKNTNYFKNVRLFASGQQLWVFTKYLGGNPEASGEGGGNSAGVLSLGNDYSTYPVPRTITFGANISF